MKKETKNTVNGLLLWIFNNVLAIIVFDSAFVFFRNIVLFNDISTTVALRFIFFGIPWIISGSIIIGLFVDSQKGKSDELLKLVRKKGILVQTMPKGTSFLFEKREQYKKDLGAVSVKNIFGDITNVYLVYEDFDGSIKYYDYPQITEREA